ncbi:MAG: PD40 domain-containing protein [Anaerolineae bacterium]|nr:PD40 domain-containing protein [Anaerolineae bacterium]
MNRRIFFVFGWLMLVALASTACFPAGPSVDPTVEAQLATLDAENGRPTGRYAVFLASPDGKQEKLIYGGNRLRHSLSVSPDGEWVLYVEYTADQNDDGVSNEFDFRSAEIGLMRVDGSDAHLITNNSFMDITPAWAPDGRHIIFASDRDNPVSDSGEEGALDLYVMDLDGENAVNITNTSDFIETDPSWAGDTVVMLHYSASDKVLGIWKMDCSPDALEACGNIRKLTDPSFDKESERTSFGDFDPKISPDGTTVVFYRHQNEDWEINGYKIGDWDIYTIPVDGSPGDETLISQGDEADLMPSWSPDGKRLVFWAHGKDMKILSDLFIIDADGGNRTMIERDNKLYYAQMPAWVDAAFLKEEGADEPWLIYTVEWADGGRQESN